MRSRRSWILVLAPPEALEESTEWAPGPEVLCYHPGEAEGSAVEKEQWQPPPGLLSWLLKVQEVSAKTEANSLKAEKGEGSILPLSLPPSQKLKELLRQHSTEAKIEK